jgi:surface carbohydrate biosynthesis protein
MFFKKNLLRIKKLLSLTFYFKNPNAHQLVVFDDESISDLNHIISDFNYFVLKTRAENVTDVYISPFIILRLIKNYRGDLWTSYLITIIEIISPKVVLTVIDNSIKFHEVAKFLKKKFIFCAIQNGARYDIKRFKHKFFKKVEKEDLTKKFYIPNFFCFGQYEQDDYNKNNIEVINFIKVGSLRFSNFLKEYVKNKSNFLNQEIKYDICLISDAFIFNLDKTEGIEGMEFSAAEFCKYIVRFSIKNKMRLICAFKRINRGGTHLKRELDFYKKCLSNDEYKYLLDNSTLRFKKHKYLSYEVMLQSEVVVSTFSTMLRENLSIGRKILSCNLIPTEVYDFPLKGICSINRCDYGDFEERLLKIHQMSNNDFLKLVKDDGFDLNYLMEFNKDLLATEKIKSQLKKYILV